MSVRVHGLVLQIRHGNRHENCVLRGAHDRMLVLRNDHGNHRETHRVRMNAPLMGLVLRDHGNLQFLGLCYELGYEGIPLVHARYGCDYVKTLVPKDAVDEHCAETLLRIF
jgi:hypothetical protein